MPITQIEINITINITWVYSRQADLYLTYVFILIKSRLIV